MSGVLPIFKSSELSLFDVNDLIDQGQRFTIGFHLPDEEYMKVKEFLQITTKKSDELE